MFILKLCLLLLPLTGIFVVLLAVFIDFYKHLKLINQHGAHNDH